MKRSLVLGWLLLVLTWSAPVLAQPKDPTDLTVVVVSAGALDWPEARRSVEAELAATGFRVAARESDVSTPGRLIDELRSTTHGAPEVRGSVAVFREGGEGRAYVWISERENFFQVNAPAQTDPTAAQVLSLRVVELLRVRLLDQAPEPAVATPEPEQEPKRGVSAVWVAGGPWLSPDLDLPLLVFTLGASFRLLDPLDLDLSAHSSLLSGEADTGPGLVTLSATALSAHGMWLPYDSEGFTVGLGAGGGALFYDAGGLGSARYVGRNAAGVAGLVSVRARVLARAAGLSFLIGVEPSVTLPEMVSSDPERGEIFRFGRPVVLVHAGVGWSR